MLDVKRMRILREVAKAGSFSAAADSLSYTQSAVSQHIQALERETGTTLVERGTRPLRLTQAGEALVCHTDAILARLADAEAELRAIRGLQGGSVSLSTFPTAGATIVPPAVAEFRRRHPLVEVELLQEEPHGAIDGLRAGRYELCLTVESPRDPADADDGIERVHLLDDPMYVALPIEHPLASRKRLKLTDLQGEPWMTGTTERCPDSVICRDACLAAGFEPRFALASDDYNAIQGFVAAGVCIALIPDLALITVRDDIVIRPIAPVAPVRRVLAARLRDGYHSPAANAMLEILQDVAAGSRRANERLALVS